jgi:nucleoside-diphosphate-sugar epimerase
LSKKILFITGLSGFVGTNLQQFLVDEFELRAIPRIRSTNQDEFNSFFNNYHPNSAFIQLAGKAHDLKQVSKPEDYYTVNTELTKIIFDKFLKSDSKTFIFLSSVKAVADVLDHELTENYIPNPITHYGKSKLLAEQYILSKEIPKGKRVYILRPCMIHGPSNKGNLNLLYKIVSKGLPWPLGSFDNKRSFCSVDNICFIIKELIYNDKIPSGVYNIADDEPLSTNDLIKLIAVSLSKKPFIFNTPKSLVKTLAKLGDLFGLPLNNERLSKLTESYIVSNQKIKKVLNKSLPVTTKEGLLRTFNSFINAQ